MQNPSFNSSSISEQIARILRFPLFRTCAFPYDLAGEIAIFMFFVESNLSLSVTGFTYLLLLILSIKTRIPVSCSFLPF